MNVMPKRKSNNRGETAEQKLERLMIKIIITEPFFAILLMKLNRREVPEIETAGTDGVELIYNPAWILSLDDDDAHFVLLHEIMHCVANHTSRRGNRDPRLFNIAADHAINLELISYGYKMLKGGLADPQYKGMSAEQIYSKLKNQKEEPEPEGKPSGEAGDTEGDNPKGEGTPSDEPSTPSNQDGEGKGDGKPEQCPDPGKCGGVMDAPVDGPAELAEHESEWQQAVQQAAQIAKAQGKLPGGLERLLAEVLRPVVDWKDTLRDFLTANSKDDYSWAKANRRYIAQDLYLPSMSSEGNMDFFAVAVDTSGSMSDHDMNQFAGEITAICEDLKPPSIEIIYCDAQVGSRQTVTPEDLPLKLRPTGGGGTDFSPVMPELRKLGEEPTCLVFFTDMCCNSFGTAPDCPVLWVVTSDGDKHRKPPFGRVVHMQPRA